MTTADIVQCAVVAGICFVLIMMRTLYRTFFRCQVHSKCHRKWHSDDIWMTFSLLPLIGRAIAIAWSAELLNYPVGATDLEKKDARALSGKLLMSGRIFYLTFLWCCKFCLLELYMRLSKGLSMYRTVGEAIRYSLYLTYVGVCLATFLECRPIAIAWNGDPSGAYCRKARGNLITMAACNIATDLALILFPISILKRSGLDFYRLLRLSLLFALGSVVIITTVVRVPLILRDDAQKTRSLWASVEICVACFIAQAPFFQAVYVDRRLGQHSNMATNSYFTGNQLQSRTHITATGVTRSRARGSVGGTGADRKQDDEIGLWTIEKRVSFSVSGVSELERRGSSLELPIERMSGESSKNSSNKALNDGQQIDVAGNGGANELGNRGGEREYRERTRENENPEHGHGDIGLGKVTTHIDGGQQQHNNNRTRNTSRNERRSGGMV